MNQFNFAGVISGLEVKTSKAGKNFCTFNLVAQEQGYKNETKEITVKMTAFGKASEEIIGSGEGAFVKVSGKLDSREWQGKHYVDLKALNVTEIEGGEDVPF